MLSSKWLRLSGLAVKGIIHNFNDETSTNIPLMGYNPHGQVCEWFDFGCMCKNDKSAYLWKDFNNLEIKFTSKPYTNGYILLSFV